MKPTTPLEVNFDQALEMVQVLVVEIQSLVQNLL